MPSLKSLANHLKQKHNKFHFFLVFFIAIVLTLGVRGFISASHQKNYGLIYPFSSYPTSSGKSVLEQEVNAYGDNWSNKTAPNPDIPVAFSTCFLISSTPARRTTLTPEEITFLSKLNSPFAFFDRCPPLSLNATQYKTVADQLHGVNPNIKVIAYHATVLSEAVPANQFQEAWYVHDKNATAINQSTRLTYSGTDYLVDITNTQYQDFISDYIAQEVASLDLDGILDDGAGADGPLCAIGTGNPPIDCSSNIPDSVKQNWQSSRVLLVSKIKQKLGPGKYYFFKPYHYDGVYFQGFNLSFNNIPYLTSMLQYADGVWFENADNAAKYSNMAKSGASYQNMTSLLDAAQSLNKYAFFVFNPGFFSPYPSNIAAQHALAKDFTAFYLMFYRGNRTPMIYFEPTQSVNLFGGEPYYGEWDLRIGAPLDTATEIIPRVFRRRFANGEVWWNNSDAAYSITVGTNLIGDDVNFARPYVLQPKAGIILINAAAAPPITVDLKGWGPPTNTATDGPVSITSGSTGGVSWTSANVNYCELYQNGVLTGWTGLSQPNVGVGPINAATTYQVNCTNGVSLVSDIIIFNPSSYAQSTYYSQSTYTNYAQSTYVGATSVDNGFLSTFTIWDIPRILTGLACYATRTIIIFIVLWLGYTGIKFLLARNNPTAYSDAKKNLYWAIIGIILVFGTYTLIVSIATFLGYTSLPFLPLVCS